MWRIRWGWERKKAVLINGILIIVLSMPCVLGFNVLNGITPLGAGSTIQDLEDFIVSNNLLPIGSLLYLLFCTRKRGWGWKTSSKKLTPEKARNFHSGPGFMSATFCRLLFSLSLSWVTGKNFLHKIQCA